MSSSILTLGLAAGLEDEFELAHASGSDSGSISARPKGMSWDAFSNDSWRTQVQPPPQPSLPFMGVPPPQPPFDLSCDISSLIWPECVFVVRALYHL